MPPGRSLVPDGPGEVGAGTRWQAGPFPERPKGLAKACGPGRGSQGPLYFLATHASPPAGLLSSSPHPLVPVPQAPRSLPASPQSGAPPTAPSPREPPRSVLRLVVFKAPRLLLLHSLGTHRSRSCQVTSPVTQSHGTGRPGQTGRVVPRPPRNPPELRQLGGKAAGACWFPAP